MATEPVDDQESHARVVRESLLEMFERHRLSAAQRRVAQYLLDHGATTPFLSSIELAQRAGVSQPTVTRFACALGFDGYGGFAQELRRLALARPQHTDPQAAQLSDYQEGIAADRHCLTTLGAGLGDAEDLRRLGRVLAASRPLTIIGIRASAPLVMYLGYYAATFHPDVRTRTEGGSQLLDLLEQARRAGGSWVIGVALPQLPRETVRALGYARDLGLRTLAISEPKPHPALAEVADEVLTAPVSTRLTFDSHAAAMALGAVVLHAITEAGQERFDRRLEDFDRHVADHRVFLNKD